ncbi:MAG: hypothetical protein RIS76_2859 [Verrucomicrobiota bacterium]|jgi:molybdopterin molybdotransferase
MIRELEDARDELLAGLKPIGIEVRPLAEADGYVLAESPLAAIALPPFDNSAMDGYAIRAADVRVVPAFLKQVGEVAAGGGFAGSVGPGETVRIFTGAPLPNGADAVVMQEDTTLVPGQEDQIQILDGAKPWENVRFRGEDVRAGAGLLSAGRILDPAALALLAATGTAHVSVYRRPRVSVLVTGSELTAVGGSLLPGQIFESNSLMLSALVRRAGGEPRTRPPVSDDPQLIREALESAAAESDLILTAGGASVGKHDLIRQILLELGGTVDDWRLALKPGKPFFRGTLGKCPLLGVPGNPVSAFVTTVLLVLPALRRLQGALQVLPPTTSAVLAEPLANPDGRRHFVRVFTSGDGSVRASGPQASHRLASLAAADGLVDVPPRTTLPQGAAVRVIRW